MKIIKGALLLIHIFLISISLTSGLELSASTGGNDGSSSTMVVYGANVDDYANEHIGLNPGDGMLSNAFSGTGNLPSSSIGIRDAKGNYAYVSRSVSGKPVTTKWKYDWNTYRPTSSTAGSGVGAWLSLTASNAYSISGGSSSSNREGDNAYASTNINSNSLPTSSLSNYYTDANAFTNAANAYQTANSAAGISIVMGSVAKNKESDQAWDTITLKSGSLSGYSDSASAALRTAATSQKINSASGSSIAVGPVAKNNEGDQAQGITKGGSLSGYSGYAAISSASAITTQYLKSMSGSSVQAGPAAKNSEGDQAWDTTTLTSGSLSGYSDSASAALKTASSSQNINSASGSSIKAGSVAQNTEGDMSYANINSAKGALSGYSVNTKTTKTTAKTNPKASTISITGTSSAIYAFASNSEGDSSKFELKVTDGKVTNPNLYASSATGFAETQASIPNAYGKVAEISSQGLDKALGYQEHWVWNKDKNDWDRKKTKIKRGEGDFAAKKTNNNKFNNVLLKTTATKNDISILSTGFGANTALILDPRRWEFVYDVGGNEIKDSVMNSLKAKGYAVTYYSDSAVSKDKVKQMDDYKVSAIHTHSSPSSMYLSKSTDGNNFDTISASELKKKYTKSNGMSLVIGCNSFKSTGTGTWADAVSKANVRGGTTSSWSIIYGRDFINKYFASMSKGKTASKANSDAGGRSGPYLSLKGNPNFVL